MIVGGGGYVVEFSVLVDVSTAGRVKHFRLTGAGRAAQN